MSFIILLMMKMESVIDCLRGAQQRPKPLAYVMELYRTNSLIPNKKEPVPALTFKEYSMKWWTDTCSYVKAEALRGRILTQQYITTNRQLMIKYLLPSFGPFTLLEITTNKIENWQRYLLDKKKLAPKSANNILSILSVMMEEARRQNIIPTNPCKEVRSLAKNSKTRGILTLEEAKGPSDKSILLGKPSRICSFVACCMHGNEAW